MPVKRHIQVPAGDDLDERPVIHGFTRQDGRHHPPAHPAPRGLQKTVYGGDEMHWRFQRVIGALREEPGLQGILAVEHQHRGASQRVLDLPAGEVARHVVWRRQCLIAQKLE